MWLVEVEGLRLLFDPLLEPTHHCGVYELVPPRELDVPALRPDVVLVSHRHPDHFDVPSLHRLARAFPDALVITPDPLVMWAAQELGFARVQEVGPEQGLDLEVARLVTTPSLAKDEWGAMLGSRHGVAWNQVDTVLRDAAHVKTVRDDALSALGRSELALALVRWQPMHEVAAQLGHATAFPYSTYATLLDQIEAAGAAHVVPSANGASHTASHRWLDHIAFPVSPSRFARDFAARAPQAKVSLARTGDRYRIRDGVVVHEPGGADQLVRSRSNQPDPRRYHPLSVPPLTDPNPGGHPEARTRPVVRRWITQELAPALARVYPSLKARHELRFVVEVVFETCTESYTLMVSASGCVVQARDEPDWDALVAVAGSLLWEVIDGRRSWGDVLLAGALRGFTRAYEVGGQGLSKLPVAPTFLYYALPYDESVRRAVVWEVNQVRRST